MEIYQLPMKIVKDRCQVLLFILSEFKRINFREKTSPSGIIKKT